MTIEKLLGCSADQLAKMTDAELLEYFKPFQHVTRPELAVKEQKNKTFSTRNPSVDTKLSLLKQRAKQMGIDLDET